MEFDRLCPNSIEMMWLCLHVAMFVDLFVMHCEHAAARWPFDLETWANGHSMPFVSFVPELLLMTISWPS